MITFMSNEDNDWYLDQNNNLATGTGDTNLHGEQALAVCARHYAQTVLGEMIHQTDKGIPFFNTAFGGVEIIRFEAALRERLLEIPQILEIVDLETNVIDDTLTYSATLKTIFGVIITTNIG